MMLSKSLKADRTVIFGLLFIVMIITLTTQRLSTELSGDLFAYTLRDSLVLVMDVLHYQTMLTSEY
ncbi:hypothetical protein A3466_19315 [Enterobacter genomosp. S]|uniref:Diguanylate cyclase n=1 Tax=Enterobacter genomosp. S TaxID=2364151 RepID=A0ABR5YQQ1_9ENTR|nr:hypothetical protein A3466_19315 [Enterobacter genomosp. S]